MFIKLLFKKKNEIADSKAAGNFTMCVVLRYFVKETSFNVEPMLNLLIDNEIYSE